MLNHFRWLAALFLVMTLAAACGGDDDDEPTATAEQETSMTATSSEDQAEATATGPEAESTATEGEAGGTPAAPAPGASPTEGGEAATPSPEPTQDPQFAGSDFAFGWNVAVRGDEQWEEHNQMVAEIVNQSGFGWVRFLMPWSSFERENGRWDPLPYDRMIDSLSAAGLNILIVVAKAPEWAQSPDDPETFLSGTGEFRQFMTFVAERYRGKVQAWEIWNEQNLAHEWGGRVNVDEYVELLKAGSEGVRAGDPDALVVFGGLTPTGVMDPNVAIDDFNYLNLAYAQNGGEISQYFDVLGVHLNSTHNSPDENWPEPITSGHEGWNDHPSFFFRRAEQLREVLVQQGDGGKPVWITEFGWTTENQAPGYEYGANNTPEEVAEFLTRSLEIATEEWEWTTGAFVWNLNWSTLTDPADEKFPWSALNEDWSPRPAYEALSEFPK